MSKILAGICMMIFCLFAANLGFADLDPATIETGHVYLFDNVSGAELPDDSTNDNLGTIVGDPQVVAGLNGKALKFDGVDDGVKLPDSPNINSGGPWTNRTVFVVFNAADAAKSDAKQTIFEEGGRTRGLCIYVFDGEVYVGGWNRAEYNWNPGAWISAPIGSNEWHAVAFVLRDTKGEVEPDKFEMWLDGGMIGKEPGGQMHGHGDDTGIGHTNQNVVFHDDDGSGTDRDFFAGIIDEIWILNEALSPADLSLVLTSVKPADKLAASWGSIKVQR